jgi:hypothetical protein
VLGRLRYLLTPLVVLDLLAVLPFYLPLLLPFDLRYPATMWWAVATLSTMGIDMRPVTPLGKILASLIAVCGILLFALPAGIIGSGFVQKYMEARQDRICPHCGKSLEEAPASDPPADDSSKRRG